MYQQIMKFYQTSGLYESAYEYEDKIRHLVFFYHLQSVGISDIQDYCTLRSLQGVKNATINRELTVMRSAINYYNKHHDTAVKNPFNGFNLFEPDYLPRYLTVDECRKLLNVCYQYNNKAFYVYVGLLLNTGCRSGELLSLKWDCVNLSQGYIVIRNSLSKNRKTVYKPLNNQAIRLFDELEFIHGEWVFYNPKTDYRYKTFRRAWLWAMDETGLNCRIHDLRHTFASILVSQGVPLYHVSQLLGHSDTRITQKYAHLSPDNLASVVEMLSL